MLVGVATSPDHRFFTMQFMIGRPARVAAGFLPLLVAAARLAAQCPDGSPPPCGLRRADVVSRVAAPPPANVRARRILLLPFRNVTRAPAQEWLVSGAPIMLAAALGQFRDLTVVPEERLAASLRRSTLRGDESLDAVQLRRIANETGGWTAVSGTIIASGRKMRVGVQALDVATTQVLTRVESDIDGDADVRLAFDTLAARLLTITGVTKTNAVDLGALTTKSVDAFREYVTGVDALRRAEGRAALDAFGRAVKLDSTFALAWARLGLANILWETSTVLDPRSVAYTAVGSAMRLASRLPVREERFIRAMQSTMVGRIGSAKAIIDSMIVSDSGDVEAREYRALAELYDRVLVDTLSTSPRMRGSWNSALRMLEDVVQRDPAPGSAYQWLVFINMEAAGGEYGQPAARALKREAPSLAAMVNPSSYVVVVPVLRDSIEFMTVGAWLALPPGEAKRSQRRAAEAAQRWTDRWLALSPANGAARTWAALLADRLGDHDRTLRDLASIDTASAMMKPPDLAALRVRALAALGRVAEASRLADSLRGDPQLNRNLVEGFARLGIASRLLTRQWDAAASLSDSTAARFGVRVPRCNYLNTLSSEWSWPLPLSLRAAVMDTVASRFLEVTSSTTLGPCALLLGTVLARDSLGMQRDFALRRAYALFDSVAMIPGASADAALSRAAALARTLDSTNITRLRANERYVRNANDWSMPRRFAPGDVVVSGDSVSVGFRWISPDAGTWDIPETLIAWFLRAQVRVGLGSDTTNAVIFAEHPFVPRVAPVRGGLTEAVAALTTRGAGLLRSITDINGLNWPADVRVEGDVVRIVVRGELAQAIRRSRPATAQFGLVNCGVVTGGLCGSPIVRIDYR